MVAFAACGKRAPVADESGQQAAKESREDTGGSPAPAPSADNTSEKQTPALDELVPGEEREVQPGTFMTMHRAGAELPGADGWHAARSTLGGFFVEMPLPFNDFRIRSPAEDGTDEYIDIIGAKTPGLLAYSVICTSRSDGKMTPGTGRKAAEALAKGQGEPTVLERPGWTGYEVLLAGKAHIRVWESSSRVCQAIIEAQGDDSLPAEALRLRFLDSLVFE